jgi:chemotaxis protein CheD
MKPPSSYIEVYLHPGEWYFGGSETRIKTLLGSCVSITMWHPKLRIGGMCHYVNASKGGAVSELSARFAEDAMKALMDEAKANNTDPRDYEYTITGGGSMFQSTNKNLPCANAPCKDVMHRCPLVSCKNVAQGLKMLQQKELPIVLKHIGGRGHRNVSFDLWDGKVGVKHNAIKER